MRFFLVSYLRAVYHVQNLPEHFFIIPPYVLPGPWKHAECYNQIIAPRQIPDNAVIARSTVNESKNIGTDTARAAAACEVAEADAVNSEAVD